MSVKQLVGMTPAPGHHYTHKVIIIVIVIMVIIIFIKVIINIMIDITIIIHHNKKVETIGISLMFLICLQNKHPRINNDNINLRADVSRRGVNVDH